MHITLDIIIMIALFVVLWLAADFAVKHIKYIWWVLWIKLFALGIVLWFCTTFPEFFVWINSLLDNSGWISVGNFLGATVVIFGLILGVSLLLNRKIETSGNLTNMIPEVITIFLPVVLWVDWRYGTLDGVIMIAAYIGLIYYLYIKNKNKTEQTEIEPLNRKKVLKSILFAIIGVIIVVISAHYVVEITLNLLQYVKISKFLVWLLAFSIWTNLPEITIAVTSWRKKSSGLSLKHLISSAFTNTLALGILAISKPFSFEAGISYWIIWGFSLVLLVLTLFFYRSEKKMDIKEWAILFAVYALFMAVNFFMVR